MKKERERERERERKKKERKKQNHKIIKEAAEKDEKKVRGLSNSV